MFKKDVIDMVKVDDLRDVRTLREFLILWIIGL